MTEHGDQSDPKNGTCMHSLFLFFFVKYNRINMNIYAYTGICYTCIIYMILEVCPIRRQHCLAGVQWTLPGEGIRGTGGYV